MTKEHEGDGGFGTGEPAAVLHGRLLNVSRLATIGEIAAGIAHELNQPLTAIANYASACERLLARPNPDVEELREALREIAGQTTRAADIIRRLRDLARSHLGERVPANLNSLVEELEELMRTDATLHGVQLVLELSAQLPEVRIDAGQIQHVVLNFVRNSLEALTAQAIANPKVAVRTSAAPDNGIELAVLDNGPGLAPELVRRIFDPFFSTKENGTGLGLAISSTIARAHGGSVGYRANRPAGACFYILLPSQPHE